MMCMCVCVRACSVSLTGYSYEIISSAIHFAEGDVRVHVHALSVCRCSLQPLKDWPRRVCWLVTLLLKSLKHASVPVPLCRSTDNENRA